MEEGSLVNKSLLFSDIAAGMFGLFGNEATPNKAFEFLGKFNQHWWKRVTNGTYVEAEGAPITTIFTDQYNTNRHSIKYSDSVVIDSNTGSVSLGEPIKTISISVYGKNNGIVDSAWDNIKGKYFVPHIDGADADYIAFLNSDAEISFQFIGSEHYDARLNVPSGKCYKVVSKISEGETSYVYSEDRNKYPDYGEQNGYFYTYIGVPFENAVTAPAIETGSYVGTGKYGKSNPNSLTFDFVPRAVWVFCVDGSSPWQYLTATQFFYPAAFGEEYYINNLDNRYNTVVTWNGNTVSWYCNPWSSSYDVSISQKNASGKTYYYIAIG